MPLFAVAFALTIAPAFAKQMPKSGTNNFAVTNSAVVSVANTGLNSIEKNKPATTDNKDKHNPKLSDQTTCNTCGANTIKTGKANSTAVGVNAVNTNVGDSKGGTNNVAFTNSLVGSGANSGANEVSNNVGGTNSIDTGTATSTAVGINLVNSNVSF